MIEWDQLEKEAFRYLQLMPQQLYSLTPREYANLIQAKEEQINDDLHRMAIQALMYRTAMNKKHLKFTDLIGNKKKPSISDRATIHNKRQVMQELEAALGDPNARG